MAIRLRPSMNGQLCGTLNIEQSNIRTVEVTCLVFHHNFYLGKQGLSQDCLKNNTHHGNGNMIDPCFVSMTDI